MTRVEMIGALACGFVLAAGVFVDLELFGTAFACALTAGGLVIALGGMTA